MDKSPLKKITSACPQWMKNIINTCLIFLLKRSVVRYFGEIYYKVRIQELISDFVTPEYHYSDYVERKVHYFIGSMRPGGAERQLANTVIGMHGQNWDVTVSCEYYDTEEDKFYGKQLAAKDIIVAKLFNTVLPELLANKSATPGVYAYLNKIIENKASRFERSIFPYVQALLLSKPQVVHAWLDLVNIRAGIAALIAGVPRIILSQRNVSPDNFLLYLPEMHPGYLTLLQSPRVTLLNNSHAGALDYCRWLGIKPDKINVVHNGFYFSGATPSATEIREFRDKYNIPNNAPVMGGVLRFYEEKQPLFWIEIARRVLDKHPECYFVLVGDGILLEQAKRYADQLKLSERITFTGLMRDVRLAMVSMDVFVLSSRKEGLPNVLIEAQSVGIPVVAPDVGGVAEALWEGKTGYAIKNAGVENMVERIVVVLKDPEFRNYVKRAGPEFISNKFGLETMIRNTMGVYGVD